MATNEHVSTGLLTGKSLFVGGVMPKGAMLL
jgi:hypothetical protein